MYTIVLNDNNELVTTIKERIMQRSKLVNTLHFLIAPMYKDIDMSEFTVMLEYVLPISREYHTEVLTKSEELYKDMLEYKVPFDTCLTKEAGRVELQLSMIKSELDEDGNSVQRVRKTSTVMINITPISAWSDIVADSALSAIDQRIIQLDAMLNATNEMSQYLYETKADNVMYSKEGQYIQLTANGVPIGSQIAISDFGTNVTSVQVDEDGNLVVNYSDGRTESIGQLGAGSCVGTYIPSYSQDGILTFTLKEESEEPVYEFDIDKSNDWIPIEGVENDTSYIWESL